MTHPFRLDDSQQLLIERFEAAYNSIDHFLRNYLNRDQNVEFNVLLHEFGEANGWWRDKDLLRTAGKLRNVVVHGKTSPGQPIAVPTMPFVEQMEAVMEKLTKPQRVFPTFAKTVEKIAPSDSIVKVLNRIAEQDFSQFPVYEGGAFIGLLTENGLTRWIARHVRSSGSMVELADHTVVQVLRLEETKKNCEFARATKRPPQPGTGLRRIPCSRQC